MSVPCTWPRQYRTFFNHDGFCVYSNASRYQDIRKPVGLAQVHGYVDEVAEAGVEVLALCPNMYQLPGWDSVHYPYWRAEAATWTYPDTAVGRVIGRCREFILAGNDLIRLSLERARHDGIAFFLTWRMNESHGVSEPGNPGNSQFWREHPELRIGGAGPFGWCEEAALCFANGAVRDYQFGFIEELCSRYDIDGLELDFLRFPYFFRSSMPFAEKAPIMTGFIRRVRAMLDAQGKRIPICARVHNRLDLAQATGLDIGTWLDEGLVQMLNVSPFYVTHPDSDIEGYRQAFPDAVLFAEMTQCMTYGKSIELSVEQSRKTTPEVLQALAHSFLERGADGISLFNFAYYRDYSFGNPDKLDRFEPPYEALRGIASREVLAGRPKHYYAGANPFWSGKPSQLPVELVVDRPVRLRIHVADKAPAATFRSAVLRLLSTCSAIESRGIGARLEGQALTPVVHDGELFPTAYREGIPSSHEPYRDFAVRPEMIRTGWNNFEFDLDCGAPILLERLELALYRP
jgi:hypothetical protein